MRRGPPPRSGSEESSSDDEELPPAPSPPELKTYLAVLGITDPNKCEEAYKRRALETHPDKCPDDPLPAQRFQELREAYEKVKAWLAAHADEQHCTAIVPAAPAQARPPAPRC